MSRVTERKGFDEPTRITLLETDEDKNDEEKETIRQELRSMSRIMMGLLVSVATAAILLAINVIIQGGG